MTYQEELLESLIRKFLEEISKYEVKVSVTSYGTNYSIVKKGEGND